MVLTLTQADLLERIRAMAFLALPAEAAVMHVVLVVTAHAPHRQDGLAGDRFSVTAVAIQAPMSAIQPEAGTGIVVEVPQPPITAVMAAFALFAETPLVNVILVVTRHAFRPGILELSRRMAFPAFHDEMPAQKRETGKAMVERGLLPVLCAVALLALLALLAFVHIVFLVAGDTGHGRVFVLLPLVAVVAFHGTVAARQRESRLAVIEPAFLPVALAMTVAALVPQCAFVPVILLVAGDAVHGRVPEKRALVTGIALNVRMLAA